MLADTRDGSLAYACRHYLCLVHLASPSPREKRRRSVWVTVIMLRSKESHTASLFRSRRSLIFHCKGMECAGLHVHDGRILVPLDLAVEVTAGKAEDLFDARLAKAGGGVNLEERELAEREHASVFEDVPAFHLALGHAEAAKAILPHNRVRAIEGIDAEVCYCRCRVSHTHMHALRRGIQVYVCARDHQFHVFSLTCTRGKGSRSLDGCAHTV